MMMSSNGNIFRVTGPLWGESTGHRWISLTKTSGEELWSFWVFYLRLNQRLSKRDTGDLRRHRAHYDVTIMITPSSVSTVDGEILPNQYRWCGSGLPDYVSVPGGVMVWFRSDSYRRKKGATMLATHSEQGRGICHLNVIILFPFKNI